MVALRVMDDSSQDEWLNFTALQGTSPGSIQACRFDGVRAFVANRMSGASAEAGLVVQLDHRMETDVRITDMNWMQVEQYLRHDDRAVLPLGSTEQHSH